MDISTTVLPNSTIEEGSDIGPSGDASTTQESQHHVTVDSTDTRGQVMQQVEILMQELEQKREADKQLLEEFRSGMQTMVNEVCHQVEQRLLEEHQETNKQVEVKLQYLNEIVDRVVGLESELSNFKSAVGCLFKDLHE